MSYSEIIINGLSVKLIPLGDCACGCGRKTKIASQVNKRCNHVPGRPLKFINGHNTTERTEKNNPNWKGGKYQGADRYIRVRKPNHPKGHNGYVLEHILIA